VIIASVGIALQVRQIMEQLTSILVVASRAKSDYSLLEKAIHVARGGGAQIHLFYCDVVVGSALCRETETFKAEQAWHDCIEDHLGYLGALRAQFHCPDIQISLDATCGKPLSDAILSKVEQVRPDLVMKTPSGSHPLRLFALDFNDWRLTRSCPATLMLVHGQPWRPVAQFAALVNVSEEGIPRLPEAIVHTCEYLALTCGAEMEVAYCEASTDPDETAERAATFGRLTQEYHVHPGRVCSLKGKPDSVLPDLIAAKRYDVVVIGALTHRTGLAAFAGALSSKLMDAADCDFILVRPACEIPADTGSLTTNQLVPAGAES
jgi:universal stress protein E